MPLALKEKLTSWLWQLLQHRIVGPVQPIDIIRPDGTTQSGVLAAIDTLSEISSIDKNLVKELGLTLPEAAEEIEYTLHGKSRLVPVIPVTFKVNNAVRTGRWAVVTRTNERHLISLGKNDVTGFLIELPDEANSTE